LSDIGEEPNDGYAQESLRDILIETGLNKVNNVRQIAKAVNLLDRKAPEFEKKYGLSLVNDLHSGNWLMTQKGVIVMADPWYSNHSPSPAQASGSWSW
jgi:hypothetical protein